jgi:hypothetical protein
MLLLQLTGCTCNPPVTLQLGTQAFLSCLRVFWVLTE